LLAIVGAYVLFTQSSRPPEATPAPAPTSSSQSWYEVYFTQPVYPDVRSRRLPGPDARLVSLMNGASRTLDVSIYDFDLESVSEAMARAKLRGVDVRVVIETDTVENTGHEFIQAALGRLRGVGIPVVADGRQAFMHHKFTVVDGEWVQTGSWNYTDADTFRHNNNLIVIRDRALAANYTAEFERMFVRREFGPRKSAGASTPALEIGGSRVESYFAPRDEVGERVAAAVATARESVHFMAFAFTHDGIGQAMLERARNGVSVSGVFETSGSDTRFSEYIVFNDAGLDVYLDGNPYAMHHKVIIVDRRSVILGSFNFSQAADEDNDENLLIVHDPGLAQAYMAEFDRVLNTAKNPPSR
jgi:phosphatidylserine/phosphatidylglycerophosphate/cardiolipin synthase-like enzyme